MFDRENLLLARSMRLGSLIRWTIRLTRWLNQPDSHLATSFIIEIHFAYE